MGVSKWAGSKNPPTSPEDYDGAWKSSDTTQGDLTAWMPEMVFLRAAKVQAAACWPGEMGGVWAAEGFGCLQQARIAGPSGAAERSAGCLLRSSISSGAPGQMGTQIFQSPQGGLGPHPPWSTRGDASLSLARQCWQWKEVTGAAHGDAHAGGLFLPLAAGGDAGLLDWHSSACAATVNLPGIGAWGRCKRAFPLTYGFSAPWG